MTMINETISHYRITGQLGSGGMGVVYEAQDLDLGRKVALKFLPPQLSRDQNALDRFLLEARTASALNHPNICTIYAVEKYESEQAQSFIAMELLEGQNLDQKLHAGPLPVDRLLEVAIQLADALDAAHAKGIIHRDIKPANIFLSPRGQVKVLDFGLAKLTRLEIPMETIGATQDSPRPAHLTSPGATVGTIAYMSPEQARGEELDTRSDLFSLGTVVYQMATGKLPFSGATSAVIFHAILELDPISALQWNATLPPKLQEIIEKLLEKDRDLRYQSAADLRGDLKRLKRDVESGRKHASAPGPAPIAVVSGSASSVAAATTSSSAPADSSRTVSSQSSAMVAAVRQNKLGTGVTATIGLLLMAAAAYGIYSLVTRNHPVPFQNFTVTKVTDTGDAVSAALSPDGKYILSMMRNNGLTSLWLRNVPTNSNTQVQPPADVYYGGLRFSPDGNYFYFVRSDPGNPELKFLYRSPLLGGTPQKLASDVDSNITFSPDGQRFAFVREDNPDPGKYRLIVRPTDGGEETTLASGPTNEGLFHPDWSPDGNTIVCAALHVGNALQGLVAINVATGARQLIFSSNQHLVGMTGWLPDGRGLLGLATDQTSNFSRAQIVFVSYPEGKFSAVTRDPNNYSALSLAANGSLLTTVLNENRWNLSVMPASADGPERILGATGATTNFTWTRDNQLITDQDNSLHQINVESGVKTPIATTEEGHISGDPSACADGRYVVFILGFYGGAGNESVWRVDSSGGNLKQLTNSKLDTYPVCSPDSHWVYYVDRQADGKLTRVGIDGGASQVVADAPVADFTTSFDISADGKQIVFPTLQHSGEHKEKLAVVQADSGQTVLKDFEHYRWGLLRLSRDGKAVVYPARENGVDNLWMQPLDGSKGKSITNFKSEHIYDFHWSFDGKQLAIDRGHTESDVVLMRSAQP
ncbi:MAG TPA: protein kinase [Candidatus Sulfotelmatobacter sp.]